jgi:Protein of unknown function (DUF3626)
MLTEANRVALAQVRAYAHHERPRHIARMASVLADGRSVAQALYEEGVYRSRVETRVSAGGLTAYAGGDQDQWEQGLFAGAYQALAVQPWESLRYGGLNLMNYLDGAWRHCSRASRLGEAR